MRKKGISLSMNTIIIAALALIVLVVLLLIFTGQVGKTRTGLNQTTSQYSGEQCKIPGTGRTCRFEAKCEEINGVNYGQLDCSFGQICCSE